MAPDSAGCWMDGAVSTRLRHLIYTGCLQRNVLVSGHLPSSYLASVRLLIALVLCYFDYALDLAGLFSEIKQWQTRRWRLEWLHLVITWKTRVSFFDKVKLYIHRGDAWVYDILEVRDLPIEEARRLVISRNYI